MREIYFAVLAILFLAALVGVAVFYSVRARRAAGATWEELIGRLKRVDHDRIAAIAMDAVSETGEPRSDEDAYNLDFAAIWELLGGLEGLEALEQNCAVLVDLAAYLQRWHPEALAVAEQLRLNAREIEWHVGRLRGAEQTGNLQTSFAEYAQRAVVTYYFMTQHVIELYDHTGFTRMAELQRAL